MATPKKGYFYEGNRIPGTTTILGRWKESGGLLHWAFKQGQSGAASLYEERDQAADIGTRAHSMIEQHINGEVPVEDSLEAVNAFEMYLEWERQTKLKMLSKFQEIQLVSPIHKFGGTPDAIGEIDGKVVLLDWKTSKACYPDYLMQLAAYKHLIEDGIRMDTGEPLGLKITGGCHLLRFSKEFPDFEHRYFSDVSLAWEQFQDLVKCYARDKVLAARVK